MPLSDSYENLSQYLLLILKIQLPVSFALGIFGLVNGYSKFISDSKEQQRYSCHNCGKTNDSDSILSTKSYVTAKLENGYLRYSLDGKISYFCKSCGCRVAKNGKKAAI